MYGMKLHSESYDKCVYDYQKSYLLAETKS